MEAVLWSALIFGLISNIHCLGMCGPLALAIPMKRTNIATRVLSVLLYNTGRIFSYSVLGATFGFFGRAIRISGFQQYLSMVLGGIIILGVLIPAVLRPSARVQAFLFLGIGKLKYLLSKLLSIGSYSSLFSIGILNGLLPCGLVYTSLAGAMATGTWQYGALYMVFFGVGTLPMMFTIPSYIALFPMGSGCDYEDGSLL